MSRKRRLAVVVSHAIPYYAPYHRALTAHGDIDLRVFLCSRIGLDATRDPGMGIDIAWRTDLLAGYAHEFLPGADRVLQTGFHEVENPGMGRALAAFEPDAVLIHGYTNRTMLRAIAWCLSRRAPAMMISDSSLHSATPPAIQAVKKMLLPLLFRRFSAMLAIGDANQRYYETFGVPRTRIFRVPNVVDEGFWAHRAKREVERARVRARLGLSPQDLAVLYVGKLIPRKRPGDLIEALARLRDGATQRRPIKVLFAGDGELRQSLQQRISTLGVPAHLLGFVNIDELPGYYCAADVLAHPAEHETFGVIVIEAAILGLPLLLSDRVGAIGPTSIARPGENALVYRCGDTAALADALTRVAADAELTARLGAASLRIADELDWRKAVHGTVQALDYVLGPQSRDADGAQPNGAAC